MPKATAASKLHARKYIRKVEINDVGIYLYMPTKAKISESVVVQEYPLVVLDISAKNELLGIEILLPFMDKSQLKKRRRTRAPNKSTK